MMVSSRTTTLKIAFCSFLCVLSSGLVISQAAWGRGPIMLHSYVGDPPDDGVYYMDFLVRTLGKDAPLSGKELKRLIEDQHSRSAGSVSMATGIRALVEDGKRQFIEGEYRQAVEELEKARGIFLKKTALLASDQGLRDSQH